MEKKELGIAVVGSGRIGTLRAHMAARHPSVSFLALADKEKHKADILAQQTGADLTSGDNYEVISHEKVDAVFVATPEHDHTEAVLQALSLGKPVFLEKPIALTLAEADKIIAEIDKSGVEVVIGYSRRHDRRWMMAKEQIAQGRLGEILAIQQRVYNTRAQMLQILKRSPEATPVLDVLTYYVDMACWFLEGNRPVEVVARSHGKVFKGLGFDANDVTWAIITFETGCVVNLGIFYALPAKYPTFGQSPRFEILGDEGVILLDADNKDSLLFTDNGAEHAYVPDHKANMLFMQTNSSGDWAQGDYWGPIANETRSWLDHLLTGRPSPHPTAHEGRRTLHVTVAIEE
ncbi:MAG: Gfo/Idh/MocA family oxidoreductase, partial [Proteobacteria bacterium]|nr:Gfo/Idh/MocA family oxidoreductase [Pseudomonadota bacterium]